MTNKIAWLTEFADYFIYICQIVISLVIYKLYLLLDFHQTSLMLKYTILCSIARMMPGHDIINLILELIILKPYKYSRAHIILKILTYSRNCRSEYNVYRRWLKASDCGSIQIKFLFKLLAIHAPEGTLPPGPCAVCTNYLRNCSEIASPRT